MGDDSVAADQLISYVRRIESLEDEIKVLNEDKSEVYGEAKGNGFDAKIIRKVVAKRRLGSAERDEQDALFQLYWDAIHGVVRAHVENIEEFDPETGEVIPGNGAGGTDEGASVATYGAASSDNITRSGGASDARLPPKQEVAGSSPAQIASSLVSGTTGRDLPAADVSTPSAGTGGEDDRHDDRGGKTPPLAATVVTLQFRTHDPETHFLNSDGLLRLHGCQKPELCASSQPRLKLCFSCSVAHDGPTHGEVA